MAKAAKARGELTLLEVDLFFLHSVSNISLSKQFSWCFIPWVYPQSLGHKRFIISTASPFLLNEIFHHILVSQGVLASESHGYHRCFRRPKTTLALVTPQEGPKDSAYSHPQG